MMLKTFLFLAAVVGLCQQSAAVVHNPRLRPGNKSDPSFIGRHSVDDNAEGNPRIPDTSHRRLAQDGLTSAPSRAPTERHSSTISNKSFPTEQPTPAPNTAAPTISAALVAATDAPTNPVVTILGFSFAITADDTDTEVDQEILTTTLEEYLTDGMIRAYSNALVVTLQQRLRRQLRQRRHLHQVSSKIDYSGFVIFSGTAPPVKDVHDLQQDLMQDTAAVQAALDANPSIGQDVVVKKVAFDAIMDDGGDPDGGDDEDNNGAIIGGVIGGSVLILALVALLMTRRRANSLENLQSASKTANGAAPVDDSNAGDMEQPIAKQQQQTDVDNDDMDQDLDVSAVELEKYKAAAEYQSAFAKNREDFGNSLKPNDSPITVKKSFDKNREAFEKATKEGTIGRSPLTKS